MAGDNNTAVVAAKRYTDRNVILLTAGSEYVELNGTQCEVSFEPILFTVAVDVANKLISVLPLNSTKSTSSASPLFDPTTGLAGTAINQINSLAMVSTTLYTPAVVDALTVNINATTTNTSSSPTAFSAMADSFSVMLDDILLFIGSSKFFVPNGGAGDFSTVDAQAFQLREAKYVFTTFGICVVLLAAVVAEALLD